MTKTMTGAEAVAGERAETEANDYGHKHSREYLFSFECIVEKYPQVKCELEM